MYYCEKCKTANAEKVCARCGNTDLRIAKDDDVSFFYKMPDNHFATMFIEALKSQNIDVLPYLAVLVSQREQTTR